MSDRRYNTFVDNSESVQVVYLSNLKFELGSLTTNKLTDYSLLVCWENAIKCGQSVS